MYISEETKNALIRLVKETFQLNAFLDNCVYNLDYLNYINIQKILHDDFAHIPPVWADEITDFLSTQKVKMVRLGLDDEIDTYDNLIDIFTDIKTRFLSYRNTVLNIIEVSDYNGDISVKIFLEEFYLSLNIYLKQIDVWCAKAEQYKHDEYKLDKDFSKYLII